MKVSKADTVLFYDLVKGMLVYAGSPKKLGEYVTKNFRELIGCRSVILYQYVNGSLESVAVSPERKKKAMTSPEVLDLVLACKTYPKVHTLTIEEKDPYIKALFVTLGIDYSIYLPLIVNDELIGVILIYDLFSSIGNNAIINAINNFSRVFAHAVKNAFSYRELENLVEERTKDLQAKNNAYETLNKELIATNTALKMAKEKAEESDHLKSQFLNNMSHEIRTPMNGILGFSGFLEKDDLPADKRKYYINIIRSSSKQLLHIIDDILEISQLETKQVRVFENEVCINTLLLQQFSVFDIKAKENKTPLYFRKMLSDDASTIYTDETKLNKIISNLLENAFKFTDEGFIEMGYVLLEDKLQIYLKDTGRGISTTAQKTIFDRFSQEEKEISKNVGGLGLGLSIAKENTELIGGELSLTSKKGEGSTFYVTIPYKPSLVVDQEHLHNDKVLPTILIVEDEEINMLFLQAAIESLFDECFRILNAKNGKEALDLVSTENIDLILMDLKMPVMDGFEASKAITKIASNIPIVAQSAYSSRQEEDRCYACGCKEFIAKPIDITHLELVIRKYLML